MSHYSVMELCASAIRGALIAPAGKKLVVADLSNIEGRVLALLAGEEWKLQAFAEFDTVQTEGGAWITGTELVAAYLDRRPVPLALDAKGEPIRKGQDLYKLSYAKSFGVTPDDVTKAQRQVGKVQELALGFEGGAGAFLTFAAAYNIDLEAMGEQAIDAIPDAIMGEAARALEWTKQQNRPTFGLSDRAWLVCDSFKRSWRYAHPAISSFWKDLEDTARRAIAQPGVTYECRMLKLRRDGAWLRIRLPSGRFLCYPSPQLDDAGKLSYMGVNQYSRKWSRLKTYGGKLCIAKGTQVLARRGWVPIEEIKASDAVWDGVGWVRQDGAAHNGIREVIRAHGVWMTPDHRVLTRKGWVHASQSERYQRAACRLPDGYPVPGQRRAQLDVDGAPVYDLINCGPRHRYVVWGGDAPLIVHNCENVTQATSRDVLASSMPPIEAAGYAIVLSVHDELITEAPDSPEYNADHLASLMATNPRWADGLPLAAAGFEAYRYRKD